MLHSNKKMPSFVENWPRAKIGTRKNWSLDPHLFQAFSDKLGAFFISTKGSDTVKRLLSLLLVCSLVLSSAAATGGDPNIEGGGGGVGEGGVVGDSAWNPGDDGVRVSVMRGNTAVATFDISNILRTRTQWCYKAPAYCWDERTGASA